MTLNPAKMLGLDHLGSIEVGKQADLVSFVKKDGYAAVQLVVKEGKVIHQSHYDSRQVSNAVSVDH
jgi:imidazolonepropionase-like amidohydrolase